MLISLMKEEEIPQVAALEQVCFSEPWTEQGLRESFARPEYLFVTATEDDQMDPAEYETYCHNATETVKEYDFGYLTDRLEEILKKEVEEK